MRLTESDFLAIQDKGKWHVSAKKRGTKIIIPNIIAPDKQIAIEKAMSILLHITIE